MADAAFSYPKHQGAPYYSNADMEIWDRSERDAEYTSDLSAAADDNDRREEMRISY